MKSIRPALLGAIISILLAGCISPELRTARIAMNERDYDRAMAAADAELARMPGSAEPLYIKGYIYQQRCNWERMSFFFDECLKASKQYEEEISNARKNLLAHYFKLSVAESSDDSVKAKGEAAWDLALASLDTAAQIDPKNSLCYQQGAVIAYDAKRYDRAIELAKKAISMEVKGKEDLSSREVLMIAYHEKQDYEQVIHWSHELMAVADPAIDSTNTDSYLRALDAVVESQEKLKQFDEAAKTLKDALAKFPGRIDIRMNLGLMLVKKNDYEAAKNVYNEVLTSDPENFEANLYMGTLLAQEEKWKDCIPFLLKAYAKNSKDEVVLRNLMAAYYNSEQFDKGADIKKQLEAVTGSK